MDLTLNLVLHKSIRFAQEVHEVHMVIWPQTELLEKQI